MKQILDEIGGTIIYTIAGGGIGAIFLFLLEKLLV